ncbi:MAG: YbhB/YbcL family Raf kinase inhibitor-like protein, partial [Rhodobacteraceae bacterium]|nr:YbhB/YbcL family Raf kinase inhibitor-like protein [Paracoccaceae bacterium]
MTTRNLALALSLFASPALAEMVLTSPDFTDGGWLPAAQVLNGFGCDGPNLSPALTWSGVPEGTESLILTLYDPDAPTGSGWWHWTVANIPADVTGLAAGVTAVTLPEGAVE